MPQPPPCRSTELREAAALIRAARRPVFYGGGGLVNSGVAACDAFTRLVQRTGAPCTLTLMGLGALPASDPAFLGMLGMHGTLEANLAMHHADLVVCVGARFDDRVTGDLARFSPNARKIHVDIDPSPSTSWCGWTCRWSATAPRCWPESSARWTTGLARPAGLGPWWAAIGRWRAQRCLAFTARPDVILPQHLVRDAGHACWRDATRSCPPMSGSTRCGARSTCRSSVRTAG